MVFELFEDGVDLGVDGDVALEGFGVGEIGGELFGFALEALVLVADGEGGAGFGELLGDAPGDAALVGEAEDDGYFAFEIDHDAVWLLLVSVGKDSSVGAGGVDTPPPGGTFWSKVFERFGLGPDFGSARFGLGLGSG